MVEPGTLNNNNQRKNNYDFKLEFSQLKAYYNFRYNLKKKLKEVNSNKYENEQYYLVDRKWFKYWKTNIGYYNICQERSKNKSYDREINDNDYKNILPFLQSVCNESIYPLVNNEIYVNGEANPISDFIIADKKSFIRFIYPNPLYNNIKSFQIMFFHGNFLLKFSPTQFLLTIKLISGEKEDYWELILNLIENTNEETIINNFTGLDGINDWLKKFDFDLDLTEQKEISFYDHKIKVFNKTLFINKQKKISNAINPQLNNGLTQMMNTNLNNNISEEDLKEMEKEQTHILSTRISFFNKEVLNNDLSMTGKKVDECINNNNNSNNSGKNIMISNMNNNMNNKKNNNMNNNMNNNLYNKMNNNMNNKMNNINNNLNNNLFYNKNININNNFANNINMNNDINNKYNNSNNKMFNNLNNMNFNNMKNYNAINMSENKNLKGINNIQNNNILNSQSNLMSFSQNNLTYLTFTFEKYNKNIFIEVDGNDKFIEVIKKLEEKYSWLKTINTKLYFYDEKQIENFNMTLNELGIVEDSDIKVII